MSELRGRGRGRGRGRDRGRGHGSGPGLGGPSFYQIPNGQTPNPDPAVTTLENELVRSDISSQLASMSLADSFPPRPGYGTLGTNITLWTNYFKISPRGGQQLYRYSVDISPEKAKGQRKRPMQILLEDPIFANFNVASDYAQIIISVKKLPFNNDRRQFTKETYPQDGQPFPPRTPNELANLTAARNRATVRFKVELVGTVSLDELVTSLRSSNYGDAYTLKAETIQALNIIMAKGPTTTPNIVTMAGNKFYPVTNHPAKESWNLTGGLEALRGYYSSVRTGPNRILVNLNVATAAFYKPGSLIALMEEAIKFPLRDDFAIKKLETFLRLVKVETFYLKETDKNGKVKLDENRKPVSVRKVKTIIALARKTRDYKAGANARQISFKWKDDSGIERQTTVEQYFRQRHSIQLRRPELPLVNVKKTDDPSWLPPELCTVRPGQPCKQLLSSDQTSNMIRFAARSPVENAVSINNNGLSVMKITPLLEGHSRMLKPFGVKMETTMLTVQGRILLPPILQYKGKTKRPDQGGWNLIDLPFQTPATVLNWGCIAIREENRSAIDEADVLEDFTRVLRTYHLTVSNPGRPLIISIPPTSFDDRREQGFQNLESAIKKAAVAKKQILVVILPGKGVPLYDRVKYLCDTKYGIATVCMAAGNRGIPAKAQRAQYLANVAMKFNLKAGGLNWYINENELRPLDKKTIVFGIDVTHPSPGSSEKAPSIAAIVASKDVRFSQYPGSIRTQATRQEMVDALDEMVIERLTCWREHNNSLPTKVIIYRDGVSEGQYTQVLKLEYPSFVTAFEKLYGKKENHPKVSIIVVGKRHHTRFYPTNASSGDRKGNPKPGTVVDRGVTGERLFDFFLQAHQGIQGTAKPAHYVVIKDDNKLGADQLQSLTHNLCYTFGRATRAVSICPPAYYADLLCERGRAYLHDILKENLRQDVAQLPWTRDVHPNLQKTMFYL